MEQHPGDSLSHARFTCSCSTAFAGLALLLSAVGIYSVLAYAVRRRTREIGIRMALGRAAPDVVTRWSFRAWAGPVGLVIGLAGRSRPRPRAVEPRLRVSPTRPATFAAAAELLAAVALAACALPAFRASRVEPTEALSEG